MLSKTKLDNHINILEPSAGRGGIVDEIIERTKNNRYSKPKIDVIELNQELQATLKGKNYNLVHDNFLTFESKKRYSVIFMNPPFNGDEGCKHLLKAIEVQERGGEIICILNAQTIKNPYSNERDRLIRLLEQYNAEIEYLENAFSNSERHTDVEVALIYISVPKNYKSSLILDSLKNDIKDRKIKEVHAVVDNNPMSAAVQRYNFEVEAGLNLIYNYYGMESLIQNDLREGSFSSPILELKVRGSTNGRADIINDYIEEVRYKYWKCLIDMGTFRQILTTNLIDMFNDKLDELRGYDFSKFNIQQVMTELESNLQVGVEETIYELFKDFTRKYSYEEFSSNVYLFDGWKTNKCYAINTNKVIMPYMNGFDSYNGRFQPHYGVEGKLRDIEKSLNYLDGGRTNSTDDIREILKKAQEEGQSKKVEFKYFYVDFYKKQTAHLIWKDKELIKKLNIFGSKKEGSLPPSYGKPYKDMTKEEQEVIDSFQGKEEYEKIMQDKNFYLSGFSNLLAITG